MKYLLIGLLSVFLGLNAHAYVSTQGVDPAVGGVDLEYKSAVKSETASYSDAITKGHGLFYDENDFAKAYKVSRNYAAANGNSALGTKFAACIAARDVATGDTATFPCVTKGYVDYAIYDATQPIVLGDYLCIGSAASVRGKLITCGAGLISPFMALEAKASGTGSTLKVLVNGR